MKNDGEKKKLYMKFNNEDLADILNIPSVGNDLLKRIKNDYKNPKSYKNKIPFIKPNIHDFHNKIMNKYSPSSKSFYPSSKSFYPSSKSFYPSSKSYYKKYSSKYTIRKQNNIKKNKNKRYLKPKTMKLF